MVPPSPPLSSSAAGDQGRKIKLLPGGAFRGATSVESAGTPSLFTRGRGRVSLLERAAENAENDEAAPFHTHLQFFFSCAFLPLPCSIVSLSQNHQPLQMSRTKNAIDVTRRLAARGQVSGQRRASLVRRERSSVACFDHRHRLPRPGRERERKNQCSPSGGATSPRRRALWRAAPHFLEAPFVSLDRALSNGPSWSGKYSTRGGQFAPDNFDKKPRTGPGLKRKRERERESDLVAIVLFSSPFSLPLSEFSLSLFPSLSPPPLTPMIPIS